MKRIYQLIGGAGTGKTSRNMQSIADLVEDGVDPMEILFSSFTKAARLTAANRAEAITGVASNELISNGWFKTLQAVCYKCLGVKTNQMITDQKESREWLAKLYGCDFSKATIETVDGYSIEDNHSENEITKVLQEWSTARMMLKTSSDPDWPVRSMDRDDAIRVIEQYERRKYIDDRLDFADLALKFVGIKHNVTGLKIEKPECEVPNVSACIFDEYQDTPALLHYVARRIADSPRVESVWVSGDPFQCQPAGTPVLTTNGYKNIENLDPATDGLIAYNRLDGSIVGFAKGAKFQKAFRPVDSGELMEVTFSDGTKSVCTRNHKWLVRTKKQKIFVTYLMQKGDRWRVGTVQLFAINATEFTTEKNGDFRLKMRMNQENADSAWVLRVFETDKEARMYEQVVSCRFGIPQVTFRPPWGDTNLTIDFIDGIFNALGDLTTNGLNCLRDHKLEHRHPFSEKADRSKNGGRACRFLQAANLIPGVHSVPQLPEDARKKRSPFLRNSGVRRGRRTVGDLTWLDIVSIKHLEPGTPTIVYSLEVEKHHTYVVQNGIVTGNSLYGFIGGDNRFLLDGWQYTDRETMKFSYRCSRKILELGEKTIQRCSDYFDRGIQSTKSEGEVVKHTSRGSAWVPEASEDWLVIGRTNHAVAQVTKWLSANNVPWISADGDGSGFVGPRKRRVGEIFHKIKTGQEISSNDWAYAIGDIPVSYKGEALLKRGVKSAAISSDWTCPSMMTPDMLTVNGATEGFINLIRNSDWSAFDPAFARFQKAVNVHGIDLAIEPKIRAGTIHSVKGDESDNVLLYTKASGVIRNGQSTKKHMDEEHRVWYVGVTRARENLVLFRFNSDLDGYF